MIKELLEYQTKEKEKIDLVLSVEGGKVKREINDANRNLDIIKKNVLALEEEARGAGVLIEAIKKNLGELTMRADEISGKSGGELGEDEMEGSIAYASSINSKVIGYEKQLNDLVRKINAASVGFEDAKQKIMRAQKVVQGLTPKYEEQKAGIAGQVAKIDGELKTMSAKIDKKLMDIYKKAREREKGGKNIVVKLASDRCGGCHYELPLSLTHKIDIDGYIVCEECTKIIYK